MLKKSLLWLLLLALIGALLARFFQHADYVPVWDAGWYYACIYNAVEAPFKLSHFNCAGHVSVTYIGLLALFQRIGPGLPIWLFLGNVILLLLAASCFYFLAKSFPRKVNVPQSIDASDLLVTASFLLCPTIFANLFHINLDFGVMVFSLPVLLALRLGNAWMAAVFGVLMVFSKEIGLPLYAGLALVGELAFRNSKRESISRAKQYSRFFLLAAPVLLFLIRTIRRLIVYPEQSLFYTEVEYQFAERPALEMVLDINIFEQTFRTYLFDIFLFQFNWIFFVATILSIALVLKFKGIKKIMTDGRFIALLLFLIGATYLVTRHRPFNHLRYVLPVIPLFYLFGYSLMKEALAPAILRSVLSIICILFFFSQVRSIDPVSRSYFGAVSLGDYEVFNMARYSYIPTSDRPAFNRDELAYNFQFMYPLKAAELAFKEIAPDGHTTMIGSTGSKFYWPDFLEEESFRRVGRRADRVFRAHFFDTAQAFANVHDKPETLPFIEFPQFYSAKDLAALEQWYSEDSKSDIRFQGYRVTLHTLRKGAANSAAPKSDPT